MLVNISTIIINVITLFSLKNKITLNISRCTRFSSSPWPVNQFNSLPLGSMLRYMPRHGLVVVVVVARRIVTMTMDSDARAPSSKFNCFCYLRKTEPPFDVIPRGASGTRGAPRPVSVTQHTRQMIRAARYYFRSPILYRAGWRGWPANKR